jgi:DNA-binding response OmpR family regulator
MEKDQRKRILMVESNWGYARLLTGMIREIQPDMVVHIVAEGTRAAVESRNNRYCLAILDLDEGIDRTVEAALTIRRQTPTTRVYLLAAQSIPDDLLSRLEGAEISVIGKPFRTKELQHFVETHI